MKRTSVNNTKMPVDDIVSQCLWLRGPYLCSRCRAVNFYWGQIYPYYRGEQFSFHLSDLDPSCQLCRCLEALCKKVPSNGDEFVLVAGWGYYSLNFKVIPGRLQYLPMSAVLSIRKGGVSLDRQVGWLAEYPEDAYISKDTSSPNFIDRGRADFNLIRSWKDNCKSKHNCELSSIDPVPNQRVIHCKTKRIIPAPHRCEYAALSYVWGQNQTTSCNGGSLNNLPKTIEDAIQVTLAMGIDYLWVDRYCIPQDNERQKMEQIHLMHRIYSNANFTIVAAAGDGPDYGLPGVSSRHRCGQPRVRLGSRLMLSTLSEPSHLICLSKWSTRGWTYQECMHSRRLLFFTDEQVSFRCRESAFCESFRGHSNLLSGPDASFGFIQGLDIWSCINEYLKRDLTLPSDILNAIFSVLQRFQDEYTERYFRHLWGLPIRGNPYGKSHYIKGFNEALLWSFEGTAARREGFPSWSWAGWFLHKCTHFDNKDIWMRCDEKLEFMLDVASRGLVSLKDFFTDSRSVEPVSSVLQVRANVVRLRVKPGEFDSKVGTNEGRSVYALDSDGEPTFLAKVLKGEDFSKGSLGCSLDKAVQNSEANHLGIILGSIYSNQHVVFLLIVEEKGTLFERIGVCSALYNTVFPDTRVFRHSRIFHDRVSPIETQVRTVRLG